MKISTLMWHSCCTSYEMPTLDEVGTESSTITIAPTMHVDNIVVAGAVVAGKRRASSCTRFKYYYYYCCCYCCYYY